MRTKRLGLAALMALAALPLSGQTAAIDAARMRAPADADWLSYGRTYDEQRYSPLTQINDTNVHRLGLAWYDDLQTYRGVEATPGSARSGPASPAAARVRGALRRGTARSTSPRSTAG